MYNATFGKRFKAAVVDVFFLMLIAVFWAAIETIAIYLVGKSSAVEEQLRINIYMVTLTANIGYLLIAVLYNVYFVMRRGATPGKMLLGLQVVDSNFQKPNLSKVIVRETIGKLATIVSLGLGFFWIFLDDNKRSWHDKISGTLVVIKS